MAMTLARYQGMKVKVHPAQRHHQPFGIERNRACSALRPCPGFAGFSLCQFSAGKWFFRHHWVSGKIKSLSL